MIRCKHCLNTTRSSRDVARVTGWRMWSGTTEGGKQVDDVVCPTCAGTTPADDAPKSFQVRCQTCDWDWIAEDGEEPLDARSAKDMADDHQCEPDVTIVAPDGTEYRPRDLNRDGSLRQSALEHRTTWFVPRDQTVVTV